MPLFTGLSVSSGTQNANFSNTATGTYTSGGKNYKYISFNTVGTSTITFTSSGLIDVLLVGSGGGGATGRPDGQIAGTSQGGGGGGAGMVFDTTAAGRQPIYITTGTYNIVIGSIGTVLGQLSGSTAGNTTAFGLTVYGGRGAGGAGGSAGQRPDNGGGSFSDPFHNGGGGGGGAGGSGGAGGGGYGDLGGAGGIGIASSITGSSVTYGIGGGGGAGNTSGGPSGTMGNTPGCGGFGGKHNAGGASGLAGIVVVRVQI